MVFSRISRISRRVVIPCAGLALLGWSALSVSAMPWQQPGIQAIQQNVSFLAHLYEGDCGSIDLSAAIATDEATTETESGEISTSYSFAMSMEGPIGDVTGAPRAIAVEVVEGDLATTVACGEIAGEIVGSRLIVPLFATGSGELAGIAVLSESDEASVAVEAFLILSAEGSPLQPIEDEIPDLGDAEDDDEPIDDDDVNPEGGV